MDDVLMPNRLSTRELKLAMRNHDKLPVWKMNPSVERCLDLYHEFRPQDIEWLDPITGEWGNTPPSSMDPADAEHEVCRIKAGKFSEAFLRDYRGRSSRRFYLV